MWKYAAYNFGMPIFNCENYIVDAFDSLLAQTSPEGEYLKWAASDDVCNSHFL